MEKRKVVLFNTDGNDLAIEEQTVKDSGYNNYELIKLSGNDEDAFFKTAEDADAVVVTYTNLNRENLARLKNLKIVAKSTIGFDNVDLDAATQSRVYVTNVPDYCVEEVANSTVMLALAARGRLRRLDIAAREGRDVLTNGSFSEGVINRLSTQVYGLVSFGNIARHVARLMQGLNVKKVVAFDPFAPDECFEQNGVEKMETLDELLQTADMISLHTPLTPDTRHMIGEREFKLMKRNACLVNTGRGGLIHEAAAAAALQTGEIGSLATDVLENEVDFSSPLTGLDSVFITPHTAFYSEEAVAEARVRPMLEIISVLEKKEHPKHQVNKSWS